MANLFILNKSKKRVFSLSLPALLIFSLADMVLYAQPNPMDYMPGAPGARTSQEREVTDAANHIEKNILKKMLEMVAELKPLNERDVEDIKLELKDTSRYHIKFDNDQKANVMLVEAYLAHFSGNQEEAMSLISKALKLAPENQDVSDSAIVLGLLYEDYELVRPILEERCPVIEEEEVKREGDLDSDDLQEPNTIDESAQTDESQPEETKKRTSKWSRDRDDRQTGTDRTKRPVAPPKNTAQKRTPARSNPMQYYGRQSGVLKLPVEHMPGDYLGKDFNRVVVRNMNGSYFYFEPGQGQILCTLLWSLREKENTGRGGGIDMSGYMQMMAGSTQSRTRDEKIPEPAFDLKTNVNQFGDIFTDLILTGKVGFLSLNQDSSTDPDEIADILTDGSWPWSSCTVAEPMNQSQWNLTSRVTPVMMMVDTKGKVRYVGPVGGFLPRMLMAAEMAQAQAGVGVPPLAALSTLKLGDGDKGLQEMMKQAVGKMKKELAGSVSQDMNELLDEPNSITEETTPEPVKAPARKSIGGKESNSFARQMMDLAEVQKKLTPRKAKETYESVIEKYPDSLEAEEAKINIEQLIKRYGKRVE
jgi:hypothetical protein